MKRPSIEHIIATTRQWVETVVIGLNLCPFAKRELDLGRVRFHASEADNPEQLLFELATELNRLSQHPAIETTLLIHPYVLTDFLEYNQFLDLADALLEELKLDVVYQIASFHPDYQFADTNPEDVENYTNRSPYPVLHILREASLDAAIDAHGHTFEIPVHNKKLMRELGAIKMRTILDSCITK